MRIVKYKYDGIEIRGGLNIPLSITRKGDVIKLTALLTGYTWEAPISDKEALLGLAETASDLTYQAPVDESKVPEMLELILSVQEPI